MTNHEARGSVPPGNPTAIILTLLGAAFLLIFRLDRVPGLHRDEAVLGFFAQAIVDGLRPAKAFFNDYTSPLHTYLIALGFKLLGVSVFSLRLSGAILNLLAVLLYLRIAWREFPDRASWAAWLLLTSPFFVLFSRTAFESLALGPLFFLLAIHFLLVTGNETDRLSFGARSLLCGFCAGLAAWNHVISIPSLLPLLALSLFHPRVARARTTARFLGIALGVGLAFLPKVWSALQQDTTLLREAALLPTVQRARPLDFLWNAIYTLGGDGLYNRLAGTTRVSFNWVWPAALALAAAGLGFAPGSDRYKLRIGTLVIWMAAAMAGIWLIVPVGSIGSRHFELPLLLVPAILALSLPRNVVARRAAGGALIACNLVSLALNGFLPLLAGREIPRQLVYVGGVEDNALDNLPLDPLAKNIASSGARYVYIEDFTPLRLGFYLRGSGILHRGINNFIPGHFAFPRNSLCIFIRLPDRNMPPRLRLGASRFALRQDLSTPQYDVFMKEDAGTEWERRNTGEDLLYCADALRNGAGLLLPPRAIHDDFFLTQRLGAMYCAIAAKAIERGDDERALQSSEQALRFFPLNWEAHWNLGRIWWRRGREARALVHLAGAACSVRWILRTPDAGMNPWPSRRR